MSGSYNDLPLDASQDSIYGHTGRMFEEQVNGDKRTDYSQEATFNTAIWYLAEKALRRGFPALKGMTIAQVAYAMSNQIKSFLSAQKGGQQHSLYQTSYSGGVQRPVNQVTPPHPGLTDGEKYAASQKPSIYEGQTIHGTVYHRGPLGPDGKPFPRGPLGPDGRPFPRGPLGPGGVPFRPPFQPPGR